MPNPPDQLADSGVAAGGAEWALFTDWCAVTGHAPLPATAETVLMFFGDCPAAPATFARRLTAIDAAHRDAGVAPPERTGQVRDVLRGRPALPVRHELNSEEVNAALRRLPSHGWINGWFGRRDRALLVVAQAGAPYRRIAALTAGDITLTDGVATIYCPTASITLHPDEDPVLCGPCVLVRWLRALHLALTSPATRTLAGAIDRAAAVDGASPHLCRSRRPIAQGIGDVPLLPPIDPRGTSRLTPGRCPRTRCPTWPAATPPVKERSTASNRKPPTNRSRHRRPRRQSRHRQRPTRLATGNRPSHGAAPTRTISAESTAPWTRLTARPPTSTAESWLCWPTNEQQAAILINGRFCPGDPGCSGHRLTCPPTEVRNP